MPTILLIEDEETLTRALKFSLEREGFIVHTAADGLKGLASARELRPDLILLDLMLPGMDGLEICRRVRKDSATPILMLTAKADEVDKIVGLELGADDYVTKPFSMRELIARIRAQLRRAELAKEPIDSSKEPTVLSVDGIELDLSRRLAKRDKSNLQLRPKEFDLLAFFLRSPGIVFSRDTLLERVWGFDYSGDSRTVDVHIRWLREKIEDNPSEPRHLLTVRGIGYKFEG
ncbi:MAG: phoB [Dehalococcoidia bacterium]|nr:phoB [Dehalococcoidia bacterium]